MSHEEDDDCPGCRRSNGLCRPCADALSAEADYYEQASRDTSQSRDREQASRIAELEAQLAAAQAEADAAHGKINTMQLAIVNNAATDAEIGATFRRILADPEAGGEVVKWAQEMVERAETAEAAAAAAQAHAAELRAALGKLNDAYHLSSSVRALVTAALALPADDTALNARLEQARKGERAACIAIVEAAGVDMDIEDEAWFNACSHCAHQIRKRGEG